MAETHSDNMVTVCFLLLMFGLKCFAQTQDCTFTDTPDRAGDERLATRVPGVISTLEQCKQACIDRPECMALDFSFLICNLFDQIPTTSVVAGRTFSVKTCPTADPCDSEPCQNGGSCQKQGENFACTCPPLFTGTLCETAVPQEPCPANHHRFCAPEASCTQKGCACPTGSKGDPRLVCVPNDRVFCELSGDPHLRTFAGERGPVAIPCVYRAASFLAQNTSASGSDSHCKVSISAANSEPVRGQYYVKAVKVTVSMVTGADPTNPSSEGEATAYHTSSDALASNPSSPWTVSGTSQPFVETSYQSTTNIARLTIPSCGVTVTFIPLNSSRTSQTRLPGLSIATPSNTTVWSDADFPSSLCSTPEGGTLVDQKRHEWQQSSGNVGVYGVLLQQLNNFDTIPGIDTTGCEAAATSFGSCSTQTQRNSAVQKCAPLVSRSSLAKCLPSPVISVLANCFKYLCTNDNSACTQLKSAAVQCPELKNFVTLNC